MSRFFRFDPEDPQFTAMLEQARMAKEMTRMAEDDMRHSITRTFNEISQPHLVTFREVLRGVQSVADGNYIAAFYEGMAVAKLEDRFSICMACGENHNDISSLVPPGEQVTPGQDGVKKTILTEEDLVNMEKYGLDDLRIEETNEIIGFVCINCGIRYVSIQDRMLKDPGKAGCSGCMQKEKWG